MGADALPLPDYDDLPVGSLQARVRTLDADGVRRLVEYEKAHADRPAVLQVLGRRAAELQAGAQPTGGSPLAFQPETQRHAGTARPTPAEGPPQNPPSHGDPSNPAQPRD
jgi:hypothetical protein